MGLVLNATNSSSSSTDYFPNYKVGRVYTPEHGSTGAAVVTAGIQYFSMLRIFKQVSFSDMSINVTGAVAGNCVLGLYSSDSNSQPSALLAQPTGVISTGTTGIKTLTFAATQTLQPGIYWVSALFDAAPTTVNIPGADASAVSRVGASSISNALANASKVNGLRATQAYTATLPATPAALSDNAASNPLIGLTVV